MRLALFTTGLLAVALLTGCDQAMKRDLGMTKAAPDEFKVIAAKPLVMPPSFSMRPTDAIEMSSETVQQILKFSNNENVLLSHMSHLPSNPIIRTMVEQEFALDDGDSRFLFKSPFAKSRPSKADVINPVAEKKSLKDDHKE
ncbi:MAG: DUF3035 domain-containing protein [Pseudomonadota bacterium]